MKKGNSKYDPVKLEDEIDASEGLSSLADTEGTVSLEAYLVLLRDALQKNQSIFYMK